MLLAPIVTMVFQVETGALTLRLLHGLNDAAGRMASEARPADVLLWTQRIVSVWMIGVAILLVRLTGGWLLSRRLVRTASLIVTPVALDVLQRARAALSFNGAVSLLSSTRVETPLVIGWVRPAILLPASALTGLTPDELLAIVAHELAHVRRHDFLVNGLQRIVECVLFYHPAVWWVSGRIRLERERCCDDLAVAAVCGNTVLYAQALVAVERARATLPALAVPSAGIGVADRVRRVLGVRGASHDWQSAAAAVVFAAILVGAGTWQPPMLAGSRVPTTPATSATAAPSTVTRQSAELNTRAKSATPLSAALAIATAQGARTPATTDAPQSTPSSRVAQPTIAASREAAREKLGRLRVEYSADSFIKQAAEGDTIAVKTFLAAGMDINARGENGKTALWAAAEAKQLETVQALLAAGANPNLLSSSSLGSNTSPLSIAAVKGDVATMKTLLAAAAQVDLKLGSTEETALGNAAAAGQLDAVDLLLDHKASLELPNRNQETPLIKAAGAGRVDVVRALVDRGADVNARTRLGGTALSAAAASGRFEPEIARTLLDRGADVNAKLNDGVTPLLRLLGNNGTNEKSVAGALLLIQRGADVNVTTERGETPLRTAVAGSTLEVVRALLDKGADPNRVAKSCCDVVISSFPRAGEPPLLAALGVSGFIAPVGSSRRGEKEMEQIALLLIERGANVNVQFGDSTPLILAVRAKQEAVVRALLAKGADPNLKIPNEGGTPLSFASSDEIRKLLIDAGAK
jgi:ankyrin repeat protein/beta-lactamase regulating signal transducer with metallopeptidase domain